MTEADEWLKRTEPLSLMFLLEPFAADGDASERRLRLFACACARNVWHLLSEETRQQNVELTERFVDGEASVEEVVARCRELLAAEPRPGIQDEPAVSRCCVMLTADDGGPYSYYQDLLTVFDEAGVRAESTEQAAFLRDIFGNPFRPVAFDPAWQTEAVVGIARGIYEDRAFERMPILADALQDAGCENADILSHCREAGVHVRGCWVVDLVLGMV